LGRLRALLAVEPVEDSLGTTGALAFSSSQRRDLHAAAGVVPDVDEEEFAVDGISFSSENLQGFRGLEAGDDADDWPQHAGGFAGADVSRPRRCFEDATQARRLTRE